VARQTIFILRSESMPEIKSAAHPSKALAYRELHSQWTALLDGERDGLANTANLSSLIFHGLPGVSWAGFYFLQGEELVLGPFQGKVACGRIALGRGVCGKAASLGKPIIVPDVNAFPDYIACDADARSELVIPLFQGKKLLGVLDLDSPTVGHFDEQDQAGLSAVVDLLLTGSDLNRYVG
jgi:L-methionine (R)-S-oxide reductase